MVLAGMAVALRNSGADRPVLETVSRAVQATLGVIAERFPDPALKPADPFGRAKMRLWTKQLDEGVHDAGIAVLSFAVAFRHQYISRGEARSVSSPRSPGA